MYNKNIKLKINTPKQNTHKKFCSDYEKYQGEIKPFGFLISDILLHKGAPNFWSKYTTMPIGKAYTFIQILNLNDIQIPTIWTPIFTNS